VALDSPQAESDWIRNGNEVWSWDSSRQHVTHATIPVGIVDSATDAANAGALLDPTAAAEQLLASIDPTTAVTVQTPGYVAGRPVYELVVSPRSDKSTIGDGVISVDAATGIPLAVRIDARGTTTPALQVTFTSVSFDKPPASTFAFTPPPGATVDETDDPTRLLPLGGFGRDFRDEGDRVERAAAPDGEVKGTDGKGSAPATVTSVGPKVTDIGTGWERVVIISGLDVGRQFRVLFDNSPTIAVGNQSARLVSTTLVNMLVLDDGRIAVAAMTPDAMAAAIAGQ
jgi:outer membrane lipoprotein-sorting protein